MHLLFGKFYFSITTFGINIFSYMSSELDYNFFLKNGNITIQNIHFKINEHE